MKEIKNKRRNYLLPFLALLKRNIISAFEPITKSNIFKVRIDNDRVFYSYMAQLSQKLDKLITTVSDLPKIEMKDSPASINIQTMGKETINKIVEELSGLREIMRQNKLVFPRVQEIKGQVELRNQQYIPYDRMLSSLKSIEQKIGNIRVEMPRQSDMVKMPEFPKEMQVPQMAKVIDTLKELRDEIKSLPKKYPVPEFPTAMKVSVDNFPPQKYPLPPTHVSINSLNGTVKSTAVTVSTSLTPLPGEVLAYRRSLVIYNNSSITVEIGGSTFTFGVGLPVPAGTFSPAFDAGPDTIVYGRTSSSTADVRTLEISDEHSGR